MPTRPSPTPRRTAAPISTISCGASKRRAPLRRRPSVPAPRTYDYAVVRVVPRVERGEFVNAGVIVSCAPLGFLGARIELDEARLLALDPRADLETIRASLAAIPVICAGGAAAGALGRLSLRERFD